jgi:putative (di)nucleoside polyphosphate hydrolase
MSQNHLFDRYRPNVGVVLFNRDGRVWYGRRVGEFTGPDVKRWQMPQGGIDHGEDTATAAFRELKEETGVVSARLLMVTPGWLAYDFPPGVKKKGWKGQRQKWAAMMFEGEESEIDLQADDHQEFDQWRWGELEEAPSMIVPLKREIYIELVTAFAPLRDFLRQAGHSSPSNSTNQT